MNAIRSEVSLLILSALFISLAWVSVSPILASSDQGDALKEFQTVEQEFQEAFAAVQEAEAAGAGENQIAALAERLNLALNLIEHAKRDGQGNSSSTYETAARAAYICNQIQDEANELRDAALIYSRYNKIVVFSMVPVAALIVTVCVYYGLKWWRRNEVERVMKMEIRKKEGA